MTIGSSPSISAIAAELSQSASGFSLDRVDARTLAKVGVSPAANSMSSSIGRAAANLGVLVANNGGSVYGFGSGFGAGGGTVNGWSATAAGRDTGSGRFFVDFNGSPGQLSVFYAVMVWSLAGIPSSAPIVFLASSAVSFVADGLGGMQWQWTGGPKWNSLVGQVVYTQFVF